VAGETRRRRIRALLALGGATVDVAAVEGAFVHESAVAEGLAERSNERLEFLGDTILGSVVAESLYRRYPDANEGELALRKARLVSDALLAASAERLEFEALMLTGAGLANAPASHRRSMLADAFEAFLGALYLAGGLAPVATFVSREHVARHEEADVPLDDPKTVLQEWAQRHHGSLPAYSERFEGPAHERTFFAGVEIAGDLVAAGSGPSKKAAQRAAAAAALAILRERYDDLEPRSFSVAGGAAAKPSRGSAPARSSASSRKRRA
jgi:ribonuclease-3